MGCSMDMELALATHIETLAVVQVDLRQEY